jgi:hypothetical protein
MEGILQHNPFPVVAVLDQGSNMGILSRNVERDDVEVTLDAEVCKAKLLSKQSALSAQRIQDAPDSGHLSQLTISGACKIQVMVKNDGSVSNWCTITIPGGLEFKVALSNGMKKALPVGSKCVMDVVESRLEHAIWIDHNQKITKVYYCKNKTPRSTGPPSPPSQ